MTSCSGSQKNIQPRAEVVFEMGASSHRVSEYRGTNVMLVLMRTSDVVSQIYMMRLSAVYASIEEKCLLIILAVDPAESPFVDYYRENEELPFALGVADPAIIQGASSLGRLPGVPITYFIDRDGIIVQQVVGVIEVDGIVKLIERFFKP
jgi:hypothetical protein